MGRISKFIDLNQRICRRLEKRFPTFFDSLQANTTYSPEVRSQLDAYTKPGSGARLLEVGGIDRPLIERSSDYEYIGLDIEERPRCYEIYDDFVVQSVEEPITGQYDAIFSVTLLEHVIDNAASSRAMFGALKPGGRTMHYIPNMGHPYALVLRMVGNKVQRKFLSVTEGDDTKGGYPTHFNACTPRQMAKRFRDAGFTDVESIIYYSPTKYVLVFAPAYILMASFMQLCRVLGLRYFSSGFVISARRPA